MNSVTNNDSINEFKKFGFDEELQFNMNTKEFLIKTKFIPFQEVYIVIKKRSKIKIIKDEVSFVSFTNTLHYNTRFTDICFSDYSKNIFDNKEDAYLYAETLLKRSKIKYKEYV